MKLTSSVNTTNWNSAEGTLAGLLALYQDDITRQHAIVVKLYLIVICLFVVLPYCFTLFSISSLVFQLLYVGDHMFADILRSKRTLGWRTCLIVPELEGEMLAHRQNKDLR